LPATCSRYGNGNPCRIESLAAAPAGKQIVYLAKNRLHLASTDGSDDHIIAERVDEISDHPFSPDGAQLVFTRLQDANPAPVPQSSLWVIPVQGGEPRQIVPWGFFYASPAWLNNQELVFSQAFTGTPPSNWKTFRVAASGAEEPREIARGMLVELAPDRTTMLMVIEVESGNSQRHDLSLVPVGGGIPRQLIQGGDYAPMAFWSPDGTAIAVYEPAASSLAILDPSNGARHELLHLPDGYLIYSLTWDTSGQNLFYWDGTFLIRFDITSGAELIVTRRRAQFAPDIWTVLVVP
jgi:Tol biopolymer transport system component